MTELRVGRTSRKRRRQDPRIVEVVGTALVLNQLPASMPRGRTCQRSLTALWLGFRKFVEADDLGVSASCFDECGEYNTGIQTTRQAMGDRASAFQCIVSNPALGAFADGISQSRLRSIKVANFLGASGPLWSPYETALTTGSAERQAFASQ